jgi:uncharacterized protein YuzE
MKISYDAQADVLRILFSNAAIDESDEEKPGIILDFDKIRNIVGMEILDGSKRMENPKAVSYAVAEQARLGLEAGYRWSVIEGACNHV